MENGIDSIASRAEITNFLGGTTCRIVFRRYRHHTGDLHKSKEEKSRGSSVCVVDYTGAAPAITAVENVHAFSPKFSPDGRMIVYNQTFKPTDLWIRVVEGDREPVRIGFGANPRFWTDPSTGRFHVVYRTECDKVRWPQPGLTLRQRVDNETGTPIGEPEELLDKGFGGGLSADGRYLATGYSSLDVYDLATGTHWEPSKGKQYCGVSIAPDTTGRVMQLRLPHDTFGIFSYDGTIDIPFALPPGTVEWQTPDWSNHPDYAVVVASTPDSRFETYLVRISDHACLRAVWGGSYIHPSLWVAP